MYEYETFNFVKVILRRERGMKEDNGGDEPEQGTLHAHMEMLQCTPHAILHTNKHVFKINQYPSVI
jgi:hypothetical protein